MEGGYGAIDMCRADIHGISLRKISFVTKYINDGLYGQFMCIVIHDENKMGPSMLLGDWKCGVRTYSPERPS